MDNSNLGFHDSLFMVVVVVNNVVQEAPEVSLMLLDMIFENGE